MDCKITSIKKSRACAGATLVEVLIVCAIGTAMLGATASLQVYTGRTFAAQMNYVELNGNSSIALDRMTQQIRQTGNLTNFASNALGFQNVDGTSLTYTYNSNAKTLTEVQRGVSRVLLTGCESLNFTIYQRTPIEGSFTHYSAATPASCKLVEVQWKCVRSVLGVNVQTESLTSAQIVIRKN